MDVVIDPEAGTFPRRVPAGLGGRFDPRIQVLRPFPGMAWPLPPEDAQAVLVEAYGAGNLPTGRSDLQALLEACAARRIPVVVGTQCASGAVDLTAYELGRFLEARGAVSAGPHTRWASLAKLGLLLGAGRGLDEVRGAFATSWAGEPV
jgi:L-asparaginase